MPRPYRIWLYPLPNAIALVGWIFVFATTDIVIVLFGIGSLVLGAIFFLVWSRVTHRWPFAEGASSDDLMIRGPGIADVEGTRHDAERPV
jgi:hypothetical protein